MMRRIREVLRLKWGCGLSDRTVATRCSLARSTVAKFVRRAEQAGLSWPLPEELTDEELERRLFSVPVGANPRRFVPDWAQIHQELRCKGGTLQLLWEEYRQAHPDDHFRYTQFCVRYRQWRALLDLTMRQSHKAGEKLFVDYCGHTMPVRDSASGEVRQAQVFVSLLGASNCTHAQAYWTLELPEWINGHVRAFECFGSVPDKRVAPVKAINCSQ